jgi:glycolate oxidase
MELSKWEYEALEDVVGPENISQDPVILDTYNQVWGNQLVFGEKWSRRPAAVVLPCSTEEVQAVVKVCNIYGITFKPFSSGFEITSIALASDKAIMLDLKRMDKILEIDVKNMHAVVEPYVSVHRLQVELAKYGLYYGAVAAGPSAGVIASSCCHAGTGQSNVSAGAIERNVLGAEWVLPTGELLKLGTAASGEGWYSGDGPGISLRGILRGHCGANGGNGIVTKASVKLYPWYGPAEMERSGEIPALMAVTQIPDNYKIFIVGFVDQDAAFDAQAEIGKAEIAYSCYQIPVPPGGYLGEGNDEMWDFIQQLKLPPEAFVTPMAMVVVVLGTGSKREMDYREKYLLRIMEKYGGSLPPALNNPVAQSGLFDATMFSFGSTRHVFRMTGDFFINPCADASKDLIKNLHKTAFEVMSPYWKNGTILQFGPAVFFIVYENYSDGAHHEDLYFYDPYDSQCLEGTRELIAKTVDPNGKFRRLVVPCFGGGLQFEPSSHIHQNWGPFYDHYDLWQRKIKAQLDPNGVADWGCYVPPVYP